MQNLTSMWVSFLFISFLCFPVQGQQSALPIKAWTKKLSIKKDPGFVSFSEVLNAVAQLDSIQRCEEIDRMERHGPHNRRFLIRLNLLKSVFETGQFACPDWPAMDVLVRDALRMAYEIDDTILIAESNRYLVNYYQQKGDYGSAGMYGLIARELQEKAGLNNFTFLAYARYDLGYVLYHSREYASCIQVTRDAIFWNQKPGVAPGDSLNQNYKMIAWNTIGLSYERLQKYDSAFYAFEQAKRLSIEMQNDFWTALIRGNEGSVYFKMGQYDSAEALLRIDYLKSKEANDLVNAGNSLLLIAQIHAAQGKGAQALQEVREAHHYFGADPSRELRTSLYYAYTRAFKALSNADSLDHYMQKYLEVHTALETEAEHTRLDIVRLRIDNQESVHRIILLNTQKERIALIRNFSILIIVLLTAFGFLYFNRQKLKMRLRQKEILEAKAKVEAEVKSASERLEVFKQKVLEKTNLVEQLQEQLLQRALNEEQIQHISTLSRHTILTDEDWEQFKELFEKVYPGFFIKLRGQVPDITVAEQRMAALSKLRIATKEAATLLGISPNSVVKAKSRLRQRLNLDSDADLEEYFAENQG